MKKKIIIVSGDPNSINSEIIFKCWKKLPRTIKNRIILVSNYKLLNDQFKKLKYKIQLEKISNLFENNSKSKLKVFNVDLNYKKSFNVSPNLSANFVINCLNLAHKLGLDQSVAGIINCPINKKHLKKNNIGVTEYLAKKCAIKDGSEVMIIGNRNLLVSPLTTHIDIKSIPGKIKKKLIKIKIKTIYNWYKKQFKRKPRIALLGLNPHNAEFKKGSEEHKHILPAIKELNKVKIRLDGPIPSDTIFINKYKDYDIIIGMYHDQVLAPFKALFKFDAINLTLGLRYTRISPDHGVAFDKIMKKESDPTSLLKCIYYIHKKSL